MRWSLVIVLGFGMTALVQNGRAENWTTFRGPNGAGVSDDKTLPNEWSGTQNVAWKTRIDGRGWSAPIVVSDKIFVTAAGSGKEPKAKAGGNIFGGGRPSGGRPGGGFGKSSPPTTTYKFEVHCLDKATGKILWSQTALEGRPKIATHSTNTYATETPVTDGERIYAYFGMHGVYCYDLAGKQLWKKDLGAYDAALGWGTASSPVLHDGLLFVLVDNEQKSFLAALDAKTGEEKWRAARDEKTTYASPIIWKNKDRTELVTVAGRKARSYDPKTGKVLWELSTGGGRASATPVGDAEQLYFGTGGGRGGFGGGRPGGAGGGTGGGGGLFAVKAGANGDITPRKGETTSAGVAWSDSNTSTANASPLVYQGYLYILDQNGGTVTCVDVKTGKQAYKDRLRGARAFWASPWAYDGKIFCLDDGGTTHVLQAGPEFKVLGSNSIDDQFWATAALADGALLLRGVEGVYCIKKK